MLSKLQRIEIGKLSAAAFKKLDDLALIDYPPDILRLSTAKRAQWWRQAQRMLAVGGTDMDVLGQEAYLPLIVHFAQLAGDTKRAYDAQLKIEKHAACHQVPGCAYLRAIREALSSANLPWKFAQAIMWDMRSQERTRDVEQLAEHELKHLMFTVQARCRAKLEQLKPASDAAPLSLNP